MWCGATSQRNEGKPLETGKKKKGKKTYSSQTLYETNSANTFVLVVEDYFGLLPPDLFCGNSFQKQQEN